MRLPYTQSQHSEEGSDEFTLHYSNSTATHSEFPWLILPLAGKYRFDCQTIAYKLGVRGEEHVLFVVQDVVSALLLELYEYANQTCVKVSGHICV